MSEAVKRCPICGGEPQYVHYCIPGSANDPDGLYVLLKRLECKKCGASVAQLCMTIDDAVQYWNAVNPETGKRYVLQRYGTEYCCNVEKGENENE